jgi:hypothetical protein
MVANGFANPMGPTRGLLALSRARALSQTAFRLAASSSRWNVFAEKF